jgi:AcrR family transcriptional regulator
MNETTADAPRSADPPATRFRRATDKDALALAREVFLADERVDMQALAAQLGVARATLHRWVQTREALLDQVLGELASGFLELSRSEAQGQADEAIADTVRIMVTTTARFEPLRGFVRREPELALRLLMGEGRSVPRNLLAGLEEMLSELLPDEAPQLHGFAEAVVQVGLALCWPTLVAGDEPSGERIAGVALALLAGARAGALPS